MSVQQLEQMTTLYTVDLEKTPIGWGWTVYRDDIPIGRVGGWFCIRYWSKDSALSAARKYARHDRERHRIHLDA